MTDNRARRDSDGYVPNDPLTGHCYDGIEEYDNPMPGWWKWMFVATIVFSLGYIPVYHGTQTRRLTDYYEAAVAENLRLQFADLGDLPSDNETILKYAHDDKWVTVGKSVFSTNCISCHGAEAQGLVGPNLTDEFWKNVQHPEDIAKVIRDGAAGGAMPAWKNRLHPNELVLAASYVISLQGTNPSGAKKAEGKRLEPWSAVSEDGTRPATPEAMPPRAISGRNGS